MDVLAEKQICLDGKKLRGHSPHSRGNKGLYSVNAWVSENRLCIGQHRVCDKSNEIDAIPKLLEEMDIIDAVVTVDAMGCQKHIARQIIKQNGHYLLAVKGNQKELLDEVSCAFKANSPGVVSDQWEYDHGRFETRRCSILWAASAMDQQIVNEWVGLQAIVKLESSRNIGQKPTLETRYYLSDEQEVDALYFSRLIRVHRAIKNHLHWHLDVTFRQDACRVRKGNAPENLTTLRKLALQIVSHHDDKLSLKKRRVKATYYVNYMKSPFN